MLRLLPPGVLRQEQQRKKTRLCKRLTYARGFSAAAKRARAQSLNFNRSGGARTRDHQMPIIVPGKRSPQKPPKIKGSGQWKSSTPEYICKMGEAPPEIPQKILPALQGGSQGHKRGCSFVISDLVMSKHEELAAQRHAHSVEEPFDFYITNNMFDETRLYVGGFGRGIKRQRVLAASGQVTWKAKGSDSVQDQRVVRPPEVLSCYTAAVCANVVGKEGDPASVHPVSARPAAQYYGSLTATDAHSVNTLLSKWIIAQQSEAGQNFFHLAMLCIQHKTGAVVEKVTKFLGLLSPSFCMASCLSDGDFLDNMELHLFATLSDILDVRDPAEAIFDEEVDRREKQLARELLEQCYVLAGDCKGDEEAKEAAQARRRQQATQLLNFFPYWGQHEKLIHPCPAGCCGDAAKADRVVSLGRACELIKLVLSPSISTPAANRYTKVDPVVRKVALITNFAGLMRRALASKLQKASTLSEADSAAFDDPDAVIGIPKDAMKHFKNVANTRLHRMLSFLRLAACVYLPLVWLVVCSSIMVIHYHLFEYGTWSTDNKGAKRCNLFDFCRSVDSNPVVVAMTALASMMLDPFGADGSTHLLLLRLKFGDNIDLWPMRVIAALHVSLVIAFCNLWRKLFHYFDAYPWLLVPAFDDQLSRSAQEEILEDFLKPNLNPCCVDPGLGAKLRALTTVVSDYFDSPLRDFLKTLFERVVVTSTQVELQFARMSLWTAGGGRGPRICLPTLSSHAVIADFLKEVKHWRRELADYVKPDNRSRPAWTKATNAGARTSHLHLFMKNNRELLEEVERVSDGVTLRLELLQQIAVEKFSALDEETQAEYYRRARLCRGVAAATPRPIDRALSEPAEPVEGPWLLASRGQFHIRPGAVADHVAKTKFADIVTKWTSEHRTKIAPSPDFPETIVGSVPCSATCCRTLSGLDSNSSSSAHLSEHIRLILMACVPTQDCVDPTVLLMFLFQRKRFFMLVGHCQDLDEKKTFQADFLAFQPVEEADFVEDLDLPLELKMARGPTVLGVRWPDILSEQNVVSNFIRIGDDWQVSVLRNRVVGLDRRLVTAVDLWPFQRAHERHQQILTQRACAKALRKVLHGAKKAARRRKGAKSSRKKSRA